MPTLPVKPRLALAIEYPLLQQGGMEVLLRELIPSLSGPYELVLVTGDRGMAQLGDFARFVKAHFSWDARAASEATARRLACELKAAGVDLVHFHGGEHEWQTARAWRSPLYHAMKAGLPCLLTNHLAYPLLEGYARADRPKWQKLLLLPRFWISRAAILRQLAAEVLVSHADFALMRRNFFPFAGKFRHIYHSRLRRDEAGPPQAQREKVVLSLGTLCERKGQVILARAFAAIAERHPEWQLHLVGRRDSAAYVDEVKAVAADAGLAERITILPPTDDPRPVLGTAAIFAMPSLIEPLGLSLQEALYLGAACVGSNVGGIPELIDHESTGLLVPPGDVAALAAALDRLMSDETLRSTLAQQAPPSIVAKGMLAETMTARYLRLYQAILAGETPPRES